MRTVTQTKWTSLLALTTLIAFASGVAPSTQPSLDGDWTVRSMLTPNGPTADDELPGIDFRIDGGKISPILKPREVAVVTIDATQTPGLFDVQDPDGGTTLGIFRMDGDGQLTLSSAWIGEPRPTSFDAPTKSDRRDLLIAQRGHRSATQPTSKPAE